MPNKKKKDKLDMEELAASYGWSYAVLKSQPELKKLFQQAVKNDWTEPRFVAKLRNTKWYKTHSESARQAFILQKSDKAEWGRRVKQMNQHIQTVYAQTMGEPANRAWIIKAARQAVIMGWTDEEIRSHVVEATNIMRRIKTDELGGEAGRVEDLIKKASGDYGVKVSNQWIANRVLGAMRGVNNPEEIMHHIQTMAKGQYRAFADEIDRGATVREIAESYIQSKAKLLELNPESIDVFDGDVQKALTRYDPDKGKPKPMAVWEFENGLRNDGRWLGTQNAQDSFMGVGHGVLQQMGILT